MNQLLVVSLNSCLDRTLRVPRLQPGEVHHVEPLGDRPAGKGLNVARILAALGSRPRLFGFVGAAESEAFGRTLTAAGVAHSLIALPAPTRVNTTIIDDAGQTTHLRERGSPVPPEKLHALETELRAAAAPDDWLIFCGSLPPELSAAAYGAMLRRLRPSGGRLAVDHSGPALAAALAAGAQLIKPNREELAELLNQPPAELELPAAFTPLLTSWPGLTALVSDGERGAWLASATACRLARHRQPLTPVNTVGAGDALLAGFLHAAAQGLAEPQCLEMAVQVAGASLGRVAAGELESSWLGRAVEILAVRQGNP